MFITCSSFSWSHHLLPQMFSSLFLAELEDLLGMVVNSKVFNPYYIPRHLLLYMAWEEARRHATTSWFFVFLFVFSTFQQHYVSWGLGDSSNFPYEMPTGIQVEARRWMVLKPLFLHKAEVNNLFGVTIQHLIRR